MLNAHKLFISLMITSIPLLNSFSELLFRFVSFSREEYLPHIHPLIGVYNANKIICAEQLMHMLQITWRPQEPSSTWYAEMTTSEKDWEKNVNRSEKRNLIIYIALDFSFTATIALPFLCSVPDLNFHLFLSNPSFWHWIKMIDIELILWRIWPFIYWTEIWEIVLRLVFVVTSSFLLTIKTSLGIFTHFPLILQFNHVYELKRERNSMR